MEAGNNAGALVKEGFVFLDGKRLFARLFSSSQLFLFASNEDAQPLQQIACGPELKIQGENSVETEKWIKALVDIAKFQEDRSRVILEAMPADVRESLLPAVNAAPVSSNKSGESVRLLVRTLTGTSASHTVARGATVLQLKQLLVPDQDPLRVNLIFGAALLANDATLHALPDDAVLFLVVKSGQMQKQQSPAQSSEQAQVQMHSHQSQEELANKLTGLGRQMLDLGDFDGAARAAAKALQVAETVGGATQMRALLLFALVRKKQALYAEATTLYDQALALAEKMQDNMVVLGEINGHIGDVKRKLEQYGAASECYARAEALLSKAGETGLLCPVLIGMGLVAKKNNQYDSAKALYQRALASQKQGTAKWAEIAYNMADVLRKENKLAEAKKMYLDSLAVMERVLGPDHPEVAECCNALAMLQKKEGDYANARVNYERALKIVSEKFGSQHPKIGIYSVNLGDIFRKIGDWAEAERAYERALPILEKSLGPDNVEVAEALNSQGLVLKKKAEYDAAEVLYQRAIAIILKTFDKTHYKFGQYSNNLGDCYRKRGQYDEALRIYQESLAALTGSLGAEHAETAEVQHNVAMVLHQLQRYQEAAQLFSKAIAVIRKQFGEGHYKLGVFSNNFGMCEAMLGEYGRAHGLLVSALDILRKKLGADHIEVADVLSTLGDVCMKLFVQMHAGSKLAEAHDAYVESRRIVLASLGANHPKCVALDSLLAICDSMRQTQLVDNRPIELVQVVLYDVSGSMETKTKLAAKGSVLDRREISKAFFGAFIDKEIAYRMPHALGLVTFGNVVTEELAITREFEAFATLFGEISKLQGATHLLDAVVRASGLIDEYCLKNANLLAPDCARRILCLSDGEDSGSKETCETALKALQKAKCILDSVPIEGAHAKMRALSNASGGLCFLVKSFEEGISLFEREAVLSLRHRLPHALPESKGKTVESLVEAVPYCEQPPFLVPAQVAATLARRVDSPVKLSAETAKLLSNELQRLLQDPEPCFSVLSEDVSFWCAVYTGGSGTPYEGRSFLLYLDLAGYPARAPEVRFVTPVFHLNVNSDGRICLDCLSTWSEKTTVREILQEIAQLMRTPNPNSPLDSVKGSLFLENRNVYLTQARERAQRDGKTSPKDFLAQNSECAIC